MPPSDELLVVASGREVGGWTTASVTCSLDAIARTFSLEVADAWTPARKTWPFFPGSDVEITVGGARVLRGWLEQMEPSYERRESRRLSASGRDVAGDLVDCSALHVPDELRDVALLDLVALLCEPFGIEVEADAQGADEDRALNELFRSFKIQPGEAAFEAISRACRARAYLPVHDGLGTLRLTHPGRERASGSVIEADNVLAAAASWSMQDRYSLYVLRGQVQGGEDYSGAAAAQPEARAVDQGISRYRPLVMAVGGMPEPATLRTRARWEGKSRAARSGRVEATVRGWHQPDASLWRPGLLVGVRLPSLTVDADMVVSAVRWDFGAAGRVTQLTLVSKDAYEINAEPLQETDAWAGLRQDLEGEET